MLELGTAIGLVIMAADAAPTNFGIHTVPGEEPMVTEVRPTETISPAFGNFNLNSAVSIGSRWGRISSTRRSPAHNRRVGGARNSHHLRGRAIDIVRRPRRATFSNRQCLSAGRLHID